MNQHYLKKQLQYHLVELAKDMDPETRRQSEALYTVLIHALTNETPVQAPQDITRQRNIEALARRENQRE